MRLLTFIGVGHYQPTAYTWWDQEFVSAYAPVATCHFLKPDAVTVFVTEKAQEEIYPAFEASLAPGLNVQRVPVPLGQNEAELWDIFGRVSGAVKPGEEVAFDITHGLRSFPLLGLLVAAFLRAGLGMPLRAVMYGAFDVRDQSVTPNRTPMFDLSPMLELLEWAVAADRYNKTGDARFLASLLNTQRKLMALAAGDDKARLVEAGAVGGLADALTEVSQSLRLIRPYRAMERVAHLPHRIRQARPVLERGGAASPFGLLLESVERSFLPLGLETPASSRRVAESLRRQRVMIGWYIEREQLVQAVTLMREWLVSWVMVQFGYLDCLDRDERTHAEEALNVDAHAMIRAKTAGRPFAPVALAAISQAEPLAKLWANVIDIRNDLDHAGMRRSPGKPEDLIASIKECVEHLDSLPV